MAATTTTSTSAAAAVTQTHLEPGSPTLSPSRRGRPLSVLTSPASEDDEYRSGRTWASEVAEPWDPLILTLDGGGIRGYSSLLILKELMSAVAAWETKLEAEEVEPAERRTFKETELLPCHYFDFMYGTSTGGLIATLLGRLRMNVTDSLTIYREVGEELFGHRRSIIPLTTKYHEKPMEDAVRRIVQRYCPQHRAPAQSQATSPPRQVSPSRARSLSRTKSQSQAAAHSHSVSPAPTTSQVGCDGEDWHPWEVSKKEDSDSDYSEWNFDSIDRICQSICLTATHNGRIDEAYLLRTYDHRYNFPPNWITLYNEGADKLKIWEVTRATSAAPFFFKVLEADIRGELMRFKDGGIRENNPAGAAWNEFVSLYGENKDPALLLSIGTGRPDESRDGFSSTWPGPFGGLRATQKLAEKFAVFKNVLIKYTEGEAKHQAMVRLARGEHRWYKRLNVSSGLEKMRLDNWVSGPYTDHGTESNVPGGQTLRIMERATTAYLDRRYDPRVDTYARPRKMLDQTAEKLVRHRRARERTKHVDPRRWNSYMGKYLTGQYVDGVRENEPGSAPQG